MRRRILLLTVGMTTLVVLAFAIPLAILIRHTVYQNALKALERQANDVGSYLLQQPTATQLTARPTPPSTTPSPQRVSPGSTPSTRTAPPRPHEHPFEP